MTAPPQIAAIVLAAGRSRRMGRNKLLATIDGQPLVRIVVERVLLSRARPVVVASGHAAEDVHEALAGCSVTIIHNRSYMSGLSSSIRAGVSALPESVDGALILLGDMPGISNSLIDRLIGAFAPEEERLICVPTHNGMRGNPVLFGRRFFAALLALDGDIGARRVVTANERFLCEVEAGDDGPLIDIDTPGDLSDYASKPR